MNKLLLFLLSLFVAGIVLVLAAVYLLAGFAWALLAAGMVLMMMAATLRRGMISNG